MRSPLVRSERWLVPAARRSPAPLKRVAEPCELRVLLRFVVVLLGRKELPAGASAVRDGHAGVAVRAVGDQRDALAVTSQAAGVPVITADAATLRSRTGTRVPSTIHNRSMACGRRRTGSTASSGPSRWHLPHRQVRAVVHRDQRTTRTNRKNRSNGRPENVSTQTRSTLNIPPTQGRCPARGVLQHALEGAGDHPRGHVRPQPRLCTCNRAAACAGVNNSGTGSSPSVESAVGEGSSVTSALSRTMVSARVRRPVRAERDGHPLRRNLNSETTRTPGTSVRLKVLQRRRAPGACSSRVAAAVRGAWA